MKTKLLFLLLLANFSLYAQQYTSIPDINFENKLIRLGIDSGMADGQILTSRIASLTSLDVSSSSIKDLTGIEDFVRLITLNCSSNQLVNLNLSKNTVLTILDCKRNQLKALNLDKNTALTSVSCEENQIKSLDVSRSTSLTNLSCKQNEINSLDLSKNIALTIVNCAYNKLTLLNVSKNVNLTRLECERNQLTSLDLNSPKLTILSCAYNQITTLDVSKCPKLTEFSCNNNNLSYLNLHNKNNTLLTYIDFTINPNLDCIVVDVWYYSNANWPTKKDDTANYVPFCGVKYTLIPDANFEQKLVNLALDDEVNGAIIVTPKISSLTSLDVTGLKIKDLTGIEEFISLTYLNCSYNQLTNLNVTKNTLLRKFICEHNSLTSLDVSKNIDLGEFLCNNNKLTALDVSKNKELSYFYCDYNQIAVLDVSKNTDMRTLYCNDNQLLSVNLKNGNIYGLFAYANMRRNPNLTCVQLDKNTSNNESSFYADAGVRFSYTSDCPTYTTIPDSNFEDKLIVLKIDKDGKNGIVATSSISVITSLDVSSSSIADLTGIQDFTALKTLNCSSNQLVNLDFSKNLNLTNINCKNNNLEKLNLKNGKNTLLVTGDFTSNLALTCIQVDDQEYSKTKWATYKDNTASYNNDCTPYTLIPDSKFEDKLISMEIDKDGKNGKVATASIINVPYLYIRSSFITDLTGIQDFKALTDLDCSSNQLKNIDVSKNLSLAYLNCSANKLTSLDVSKNVALTSLNSSSNQLANLDLSKNILLVGFNGNNNNLVTLNLKNGNNKSINDRSITLDFKGNSLLKCIQVDDENYSNTNWTQRKDATTVFSSNCSTLGIEDSVFDKAVVYPNPTKGVLNIKNVSLEKADVYNALGQLVKSVRLNSSNTDSTINLSGLPKGIYYVYLINQDAASARKVIVE
ncbi:T9SS type A sorting domain-containing protein [Flavobacterium sp.]|uniref:T9SS type A sorting domain-containing protein n=1 Tax=Flavobacterium sp. TaxID=239 RepID=UPI003D13F111